MEMFSSGISRSVLIFGTVLLYGNLIEYALHRWIMHTLPSFAKRNHVRHHHLFRGERRYHLVRAEDSQYIIFAWWKSLLLLTGHIPLFWGIGALTGWPVLWLGSIALLCYYTAYEYLHWCMHNPADRAIERTALFRYLDRNHRHHHTYSRTNYNVLFPLGDLIFGTFQRPPSASNGNLVESVPFEVHQ
jgi:hypothetical protein